MSNFEVGTKGTWKGTVTGILYSTKDYAIIEIKTSDGTIKADGNIPVIKKNAKISVTGTIVHNEKYGQNQIKVKSAIVEITPEELGTAAYFVNCIQGIGSFETANRIIDECGTDVNSYMDNIYKLKTIKGISEKKAESIKKSFEETKHLFPIFVATSGKITKRQADTFYEKYKENTADKIKRNPYLLTEIARVGFKTADKIAFGVGIKYDSVERMRAVLAYTLDKAETDGHIYLTEEALIANAKDMLLSVKELKNVYYQDVLYDNVIPDDTSEWDSLNLCDLVDNHAIKLNNALNKWFDDKVRTKFEKTEKLTDDEICCLDKFYSKMENIEQILKDQIAILSFNADNYNICNILNELDKTENSSKVLISETYNNVIRVYIRKNYINECLVAINIISMLKEGTVRELSDDTINKAIKTIEVEQSQENNVDYKLNDEQTNAVSTILKNRVSIVTGGPGRGKTTILKTALEAWINSNNKDKSRITPPQFFLLAPTGKAAKRMTESTGYTALTIHRFLKKNSAGITNNDTLICIDESSMVDLSLITRLLLKCRRAQIAFIGDADQLPSVGAGNVLEDLVNSKVIPCAFLIKCYRNTGSILRNSELINEGHDLQELIIDNHFRTYWSKETKDAVENVVKIYIDNVKKYTTKEMIIFTPMLGRSSGVQEINKRIQKEINPKNQIKNEYTSFSSGTIFRDGDRVIHVGDNNYNLEVFKGDTGTIQHIDTEVAVIELDDGRTVSYPLKQFDSLELGYAITYHKSQGSQYKFVICLLTTNDYILLSKKLLYTGESRAKDMCLFIGAAKAFYMAINNMGGSTDKRNTSLKEKLIEAKLLME